MYFSLSVCACFSKVLYGDAGVGLDSGVVAADDEEEAEGAECLECPAAEEQKKEEAWMLWDMKRPLEGSCRLQLLKFDSDAAKHVFWHSSAHILGNKRRGTRYKRRTHPVKSRPYPRDMPIRMHLLFLFLTVTLS